MRGSTYFESVIIHAVELPIRTPFKHRAFSLKSRAHLIIELCGAGVQGWGECPLLVHPLYHYETPQTALHIIEHEIVPILRTERPETPQSVAGVLNQITGHPIARAGFECAAWDLWARAHDRSLASLLGGTSEKVSVGISLGLGSSPEALLDEVSAAVERGYRRVKIKVTPQHDLDRVDAIRRRFPTLPLWVDANGSYQWEERDRLQSLDERGVQLIEQPFPARDFIMHSRCANSLKAMICLDETLESPHDVTTALACQACRALTIKSPKLGGIAATLLALHRAHQGGIALWIGGLFESGIGRSLNLILASRPECTLPGDLPESQRYADFDIITPEIVLDSSGEVTVPRGAGLGVEIDRKALERCTIHRREFKL